jgi:hypothetical protein
MTLIGAASRPASAIEVTTDANASPRVLYGVERLRDALRAVPDAAGRRIVVGTVSGDGGVRSLIDDRSLQLGDGRPGREGFVIATLENGSVAIAGGDDSGALYGCLELARRVRESGRLPDDLHVADAPAFVLRGPCIGMQKTYILPGRRVYEYPYTPELFPFFYDEEQWRAYLDLLVELRMNSLTLWNGQPFASLVRVPGYEYAQEVDEATFARNVEMYRFLAAECDRRGIWLVQNFYSIILPKPLAERHGLDTQLAAPHPTAADYTRKSLAEFVKQYPNVGIMMCLGEALTGLDNQVQWCTEVLLPGIKDGMAAAGLEREPPVVIRTHATNAKVVMPAALKVYKNLYTEAKFNGESLTTWEPRGVRQDLHQTMSRLGSTHLVNVHILANLEPFRYGAQRFIKKSVQASRDRLGAKGLHLYPLAFWDWPVSPDKADVPLKQYQRDWIWFEAWARYAWNPDIDEAEDRAYWIGRLTQMYGSPAAAERILDAYNDSGECAPRLLRRFGITEGNRQTLSLGMTLDQLVAPDKYRPYPELWESQSPPGERLQEYVDREWNRQPHEGETPPQIIAEVLDFSAKAVAAVEAAASSVTKNREEFERLRNDVQCIRAMSRCYAAKANAAMLVLRYKHSRDVADMEKAAAFLAESLEHYRTLAKLTENTYRYANSMQTGQRKIPVSGGVDGKPASYHWVQLVGLYETELAEFKRKLAALKRGSGDEVDESSIEPLPRAAFTLLSPHAEVYEVQVGASAFADRPVLIQSLAPELVSQKGIRFSDANARGGRYVPIEFEVNEPVQVLIGYVKGDDKAWLRVPDLETDALADERGGAEPLILNAATIDALPPVDVHALRYGAGRHKLEVRGSGSFVVLGVVPQSVKIPKRDAQRPGGGGGGN